MNRLWTTVSFFILLLTTSCVQKADSNEEVAFRKYSTIKEMLDSAYDYRDNCIEIISADNVRVSSEFLKEETESNIISQVKRDIVYVIFQTFAKTDLNKVTVTSIPIIRSSFNPNETYDGKLDESFKQTITATRPAGLEILNKYLQKSQFQDLYSLEGTLYVPNENFDQLKFNQLDNVYSDLSKMSQN